MSKAVHIEIAETHRELKKILESGRVPGPLSQASAIVRETAHQFDADISTLFMVEGGKLVLKGGISSLSGEELPLHPSYGYPVNWDADRVVPYGLTHFVAITGAPLYVGSYDELQAQVAHIGQWDSHIYPDGLDHASSSARAIVSSQRG